nr:uncharacterized protein LOC112287638 isoform X2 [Physcomitrium patens]|eukprot:XP_024386615.1 uncharacterized protein LOC112287638 isoform X2 [Physcomitrella patens]
MSCQLQSEVEGSLSEFVHFPSASTVVELQGYHGRMGAVPPLSSASRAHTPRPPFLHDGRSRPHYMHGGEFEMPDYDYVARRHSYGDHLRLDSGTLLERLLLQEQQKALQMASLVHSQTSGCLSGCHSYWLSQKRLNYKDSDDRLAEDRRRCSRNFGELLSRSVNPGAKADTMEFADGRFRQPRPVESIGGVGERSETRNSFAEAELERLICQGRRTSYLVSHPALSDSQASHHMLDQQPHVGAQESSAPMNGFSDADARVRQRWSCQRQAYSGDGAEENCWQRATKSVSRVGPANPRLQDRVSLSGRATGLLPTALAETPHRPVVDSGRSTQSTHTASQNPLGIPENSLEPSYQDNAVQEAATERLITQGPVSLTGWYIIKVEITNVGRVVETKIAVGGRLLQNGEHVKTRCIVNRVDFHQVVTEDDIEVSLEGSMDLGTSIANGFAPGIVQCLSNGFPYMWKQLLRVRTVGLSSSLAVSESIGGLHPEASKCASEDESQGFVDLKTSGVIPKDISNSLKHCESNSPVDGVETKGVETEAVVVTWAEASNAFDSEPTELEGLVSASFETSKLVGMGAMNSKVAASARFDAANAVGREVVEPGGAATVRAEMSNSVEREAVERERVATARTISSNAIDESNSHDITRPTSWDFVPGNEAPVSESLSKEAESGSVLDTAFVTARRGRKNKKGSAQPVRSSRRHQQQQSRSTKLLQTLVDSSGTAQVEQFTSGVEVTKEMFGEEEPRKVALDFEQDATGSKELTTINSIIEEVLNDLQQEDFETINQGGDLKAGCSSISAQRQPTEMKKSGQVQDVAVNLLKDRYGVEALKLNEKGATEDVLESAKDKETTSAALLELESEKIEEVTPAAPSKLGSEEMEESAPVTPPELLLSKVQSRVHFHDKLSFEALPQASEELLFPEVNVRITRSLKRRLRQPAITDAKRSRRLSKPEGQSAKSVTYLSSPLEEGPSTEPNSNPSASHHENLTLEPISDPATPLQEAVNEFYLRGRHPYSSSAKVSRCSNCKRPCSPQAMVDYKTSVVSSKATTELVVERALKMEQEDCSPLEFQNPAKTCGTTSLPDKDKSGTSSGKRRSHHPKKVKSASQPAKGTMTRRSKLDDSGEGSSAGCNPVSSKRNNRRTSIIPPPLPPPRVENGLKSKVPEAFGLKTSRSGRLLVPPLAYWRSQTIEYDKDGGIIAIFDGFQ